MRVAIGAMAPDGPARAQRSRCPPVERPAARQRALRIPLMRLRDCRKGWLGSHTRLTPAVRVRGNPVVVAPAVASCGQRRLVCMSIREWFVAFHGVDTMRSAVQDLRRVA